MARRILMFNHKGGVGKTTAAYHIGWKLTQRGKRVLLVDCDSQTNLTARALGDKFEDYFEENSETRKNNIYDGVLPVFEGRPEPIRGFECPSAENNENLIILPGHPDLSALEGQISLAQETRGTLSVTANIPGAIHRLVSEIEEKYSVDYSIIDVNPGLGALNQNIFMISHGFVVPTNPDPFSLMSLSTLKDEIGKWVEWKKQFGHAFQKATYPMPEGWARFAGAIHSRFNRHSSKAARRYNERIVLLDERIEKEFVPALRSFGATFPETSYRNAAKVKLPSDARDPEKVRRYALARIPDFNQAMHIATEHSIPVFDISPDILKREKLVGNVKNNLVSNIETFDQIFDAISEKLEIITDDKDAVFG